VRDFGLSGWATPALGEARARWYCERLEEGGILFFAATPFALPQEDQAFLLNVQQASAAYHKNISYRLKQDRVKGFARGSTDAERLRSILRAYAERAIRFAADLLAPYARRWQIDFTSFRPVEEQGRQLSLRARNDLIHVDAFPTRPTNGNRLLRVFTNINPTKPRIWVTTETFDALAPKFAAAAGLSDIAARTRSPFRPVRRSLIRLARAVGLPLVDRSPYDQFMLGFHHYLKTNRAFQDGCPKYQWEFPPNSTWLVLTDMVPHSVLSGQFALEQTFVVPRDALLLPEKAPVHILEQLSGARLTN
jgi:hypothetical protein